MAAASGVDAGAQSVFSSEGFGMKTIFAWMAAGAALLLAVPAEAAPYKKKQSRTAWQVERSSVPIRDRKAENGYNGYYERVLERVPFGSQLWWRVYHSYPRGG